MLIWRRAIELASSRYRSDEATLLPLGDVWNKLALGTILGLEQVIASRVWWRTSCELGQLSMWVNYHHRSSWCIFLCWVWLPIVAGWARNKRDIYLVLPFHRIIWFDLLEFRAHPGQHFRSRRTQKTIRHGCYFLRFHYTTKGNFNAVCSSAYLTPELWSALKDADGSPLGAWLDVWELHPWSGKPSKILAETRLRPGLVSFS